MKQNELLDFLKKIGNLLYMMMFMIGLLDH